MRKSFPDRHYLHREFFFSEVSVVEGVEIISLPSVGEANGFNVFILSKPATSKSFEDLFAKNKIPMQMAITAKDAEAVNAGESDQKLRSLSNHEGETGEPISEL